ncbi:hypothetical protein [Snuella lapsa]|uniref:Uncharacterized protein n=1 Tax=Snuella lapsa TaxID=870481 RepID=A0ABP6X5A9_9FLAO
MKQKNNKTKQSKNLSKTKSKRNFLRGLAYPANEDIYNKEKEETNIYPEDITKNKMPNERRGTKNEKDFEDDKSGGDLDVPGSELDDQQESVGSEDEENNYYSLGGDKHKN